MKVAIIGCGAIAKKAYLPTLISLPNAELAALVDTNARVVKRLAKAYKVPKYFTDYREMLKDPSIELVCVCVPSTLHAEISVNCLKEGKHVLVEKPLALSVREGKMILGAAVESNRKLCVVHNYRYYPSMREIKKRIESGDIGRIVTIQGTAHTHIPMGWTSGTWLYQKGGALDDFGPHLIDAVLWFANSNVEEVAAFGGDFLPQMGCINYLQVYLKFRNNAVATADISWLTGPSLFTLNIFATGGRIFQNVFFDHFVETHGTPLPPLNDLKDLSQKTIKLAKRIVSGDLFKGSLVYYDPLISDFIESIEKNSRVPISGEEGLKVVAVSEAAKLSITQKIFVSIPKLVNETYE